MNEEAKMPILLSLSGGGFRGYFQANILKHMEDKFGYPLANKFELIAGTSIGGINALALAAEVPTAKIVDFYREWGPKIFKKRRLTFGGVLYEKFSDSPLKEALEGIFKNLLIGDLKHKVLIPSVNYSTGAPQVFKTPHHVDLVMDKKLRVVDVALATSAAPTYFPIHKMDGENGCYMVDGGLVANHPGIYACIEAEKFLGLANDSYKLLHIGTMSSGITDACASVGSGFVKWGGALFDLSISAQEKATENILNFKLGKERYLKIDVEPPKDQIKYIALDKAGAKSKEVLSQQATSAFQKAFSTLRDFIK